MTTMTSNGLARTANPGVLLLTVASLLAFVDAIFNYFYPGNGIHSSEGALLVIVSTLLQLIAAVLVLRTLHGWLKGLFEVLIFLDLVGTAAAAYLLNAWILLALTAVAFIGWLWQLARRRATSAREVMP